RDRIHQYGVIAGRPIADAGGARVYEISDLVEKPRAEEAPSDLAIIGRYVLTPDIFGILAETAPDRRGEIQLTDGLRRLRQRRPLYAVEFEGKRCARGDRLGFPGGGGVSPPPRPPLAAASRAYRRGLNINRGAAPGPPPRRSPAAIALGDSSSARSES